MLHKDYEFALNNMNNRESKLWLALTGLILIVVILAVQLSRQSTKVVLIPPSHQGAFVIDRNFPKEYLEAITEHLASMLLNVSMSTIDEKYNRVLRFVDPEQLITIKRRLNNDIVFSKKQSLHQYFKISQLRHEGMSVFATGVLYREVLDRNLEPEEVCFEFSYSHGLHGELKLKDFKKCEKN